MKRGIPTFSFIPHCAIGGLIFMLFAATPASSAIIPVPARYHHGYLEDTTNENQCVYYEIIIDGRVAPLKTSMGPFLTPELSQEFRDKYEEKFGRTDLEKFHNERGRDFNNENINRADRQGLIGIVEKENETRRTFGEYMVRRLTEYHVDNYAKTDPVIAPAWELKDRISRVNVTVAPKVKVKAGYSLSSNSVNIGLDHPQFESKVIVEWHPSQIGPGETREIKYLVTYQISPLSNLEASYLQNDGIALLTTSRRLNSILTGSILVSSYTHEHGTSVREKLFMGGLSWKY